jgi:hypothetical protein
VPGAPFLPFFGRSGDFPHVDLTSQGIRSKSNFDTPIVELSGVKIKSPTSRKEREKRGTRTQFRG